jgi:hypothetical protein
MSLIRPDTVFRTAIDITSIKVRAKGEVMIHHVHKILAT